ncbi:MAG: MFS transporter [Planctomycetes bacterium]|nr:MFS transporter [Planctomycetota bacterium]
MFAVLRNNPQFRKLWGAQVVSAAGDWLNRIAVLALIDRLGGTQQAVGIGLLFAVEYALRLLPTATFGGLAGPIADRLPRRTVMIVADLLRAIVVSCLLFVDQPGELPLLYGLIFTQMSLAIFFDSARSGALPNTVEKKDLHAAYALSAATWSTMLAFGAFVGGVLVEVIGIQGVFLCDAATYLVSIAFLMGLRLPPVPIQAQPFRVRDVLFLTDLRRGFTHTRELGIWPILFSKALWSPCGGFPVLFPILARTFDTATNLREAGATIGLLFASRGVGTGLGPVISRRFFGSSRAALIRQTWVGMLIGALGYVGLALSPTLGWSMAAICFAHMGGSAQWVGSTTYWQHSIDDAFRGRVFACEFLIMALFFTVFAFAGGLLFDATGSLQTVIWILVVLATAGGLIARSWFRSLPQ